MTVTKRKLNAEREQRRDAEREREGERERESTTYDEPAAKPDALAFTLTPLSTESVSAHISSVGALIAERRAPSPSCAAPSDGCASVCSVTAPAGPLLESAYPARTVSANIEGRVGALTSADERPGSQLAKALRFSSVRSVGVHFRAQTVLRPLLSKPLKSGRRKSGSQSPSEWKSPAAACACASPPGGDGDERREKSNVGAFARTSKNLRDGEVRRCRGAWERRAGEGNM